MAAGLATAMLLTIFVRGMGRQPAPPGTATDGPRLAVTNSWIECCLRDLAPRANLVRLCPPGSCPGHFDIKPGQLAGIRGCPVLFRFDFQKAFDDKVRCVVGGEMRSVAVPAPDGLCIPEGYLQSCAAVHAELGRMAPGQAPALDAALTATRTRIGNLSRLLRTRVADARLSGTRVVASGHQAAFCRWLGLEVAGVYTGGDAASPSELQKLVEKGRGAGVRFVVANRQEGRQTGEALAYHLGAKLVVFGNFPAMTGGQDTFDALAGANVDTLAAAAAEESGGR